MPSWLDPQLANHAVVLFWVVLAFYGLITGGEWINETLGTLALALKIEPLFIGLVFSVVFGVLPIVCLIGGLLWTGHHEIALGLTLGGGWWIIVLPALVAALRAPMSVRPSWVGVDVPLAVVYLVMLTLFCAEGFSRPMGLGFLLLAAAFVALKYFHGKESRYGLGAFGKRFVFGSSIVATLMKLGMGALYVVAGGWYILVLSKTATGPWKVPELAIGFLGGLPFCIPEVAFAYAAAKKGQGELVLGRSVWAGVMILLLGGALMGLRTVLINPNCLNFLPLMILALLMLLWAFLRFSERLWRWQAWVLFFLTLLTAAVVCLQGYGYLQELALPRLVF